MRLRTFLVAVMALLSVFVFGLGLERRNALWLWIGFICSLISGVFVQLLMDRKRRQKKDAANLPTK